MRTKDVKLVRCDHSASHHWSVAAYSKKPTFIATSPGPQFSSTLSDSRYHRRCLLSATLLYEKDYQETSNHLPSEIVSFTVSQRASHPDVTQSAKTPGSATRCQCSVSCSGFSSTIYWYRYLTAFCNVSAIYLSPPPC